MKTISLIGVVLAFCCTGLQAQEDAAGVEEPETPGLPNQDELAAGEGNAQTEQAQPEQPSRDAPLEFTTQEFMAADKDGNGILSIEEANEAFPSLTFEDANGDGWLNHAEVEAALDGVDFGTDDAATHSVVGESDFLTIRRAVNGVPEEQA